MKCVTGKTVYDSEDLAQEALIQNRIRNNHREGSGPINIYQCKECNQWHFTSKGEVASFLKDPEVAARINNERKMFDWSQRI